MKSAFLIALLFAAPAVADPSQNPRVGQLATLTFDRGSAELPVTQTEKNQLQLGKVAAWAMENPDGFVVLDGHADHEGKSSANVRLSLARAQSVRDTLEAIGVSPDQIVIAAYGERRGQRRVVIWGTRAGMDAIVARSHRRGTAVMWNGLVTEAERKPAPGVKTAVRAKKAPRPTQVTFR